VSTPMWRKVRIVNVSWKVRRVVRGHYPGPLRAHPFKLLVTVPVVWGLASILTCPPGACNAYT
jgi:hypothetical protein